MASSTEFMQLLQKKDPKALKILFEDYHNKLVAISIRYSKNDSQAQQLFHFAFAQCYNLLQQERNNKSLDLGAFLNEKFIEGCIQFIKSIRNEYYVSSTVYAIEGTSTSNNLFDNDQWVDLNQVDTQILIQSLQQLVPSQRLVFNLQVIDGKSLNDAANLLESSIETVKSNLEKARYHLQKNIEKNLKK
jgi:RNA polymerase sigma-70 factor (ECF subfamily)